MRLRVYYEDTDCGGIVYHANYFKYCERARSEVFFKAHLIPQDQECAFVIQSLQAQFNAPAMLGDSLEVKTQLLALKKVSVSLQQDIFKITPQKPELLFSMQIKIGFIHLPTKTPTRIPPHFVRLLHGLQ
ncbi:YbgC/FadM family acyl-CoA thioesterase [Helicobacter bizzozeronii]|uniref:4-hydroxybenzoyl-CoA thioesterase family active site n=1 Tax=Helicobacter bizzozeronii (strain CIII-1) TaxID=1002804 RepID=F8KP34_HELBC|nr:YbgC/FadM family acyl-CoA thioesterase [Helicobacter bizzozeronii]GMB93164.1 Thioesterase family protein YbgC [Helicobacter bizzozeronii]GMT39096.1 Thioesterase family protein YbgC [Helicobacter bizzozeronii]CCB80539.1 4-hydroxybenzoyl-CoA thioesterase family active site [Helicobacter bizzozeronii CIII-1]